MKKYLNGAAANPLAIAQPSFVTLLSDIKAGDAMQRWRLADKAKRLGALVEQAEALTDGR